MEEKERYEYYLGTNSIKDNTTNQIYDYVVDLLNQQSKRIKELEGKILIQLNNNADNVNFMENQRRENDQLKQQLRDLPKKIVCEISESIERLSWRKRIYTNWEFDKEQLYKDLDTILKKYGGEDESNND